MGLVEEFAAHMAAMEKCQDRALEASSARRMAQAEALAAYEATPSPGMRRALSVSLDDGGSLTFSRLFDHELPMLAPWCQFVEPDTHRLLWTKPAQPPLTLPATFLGAETLFGRTSRAFDSFKGSFRFPLLLTATTPGATLRSVVVLEDVRGAVETDFHLLGEERQVGSRRQSATLPAGADLDFAGDFLQFYVRDVGETLASVASAFHRVVSSERLVYGLRSGELFCREAEDEGEFRLVTTALERDSSAEEMATERADREALLDDVALGAVRQR